jgi:choline dehydrogenase-like flavoprotein
VHVFEPWTGFQRCKWPRGKMLGGTSGLNYMLYVRGNRDDFDGWAEAGNRGWSFEEVETFISVAASKTEASQPRKTWSQSYDF